MDQLSDSNEIPCPIDSHIMADAAASYAVSLGLLVLKLDLPNTLPEPINIAAHVGNGAVTMGIVTGGWMVARRIRMEFQHGEDTPEKRGSFLRKGIIAAGTLTLLLNIGIEYAPKDMRELYRKNKTTSDPIDVAYGLGGGAAGTILMTRRLRKHSKDPSRYPLYLRSTTHPNKQKSDANRRSQKARRKIQKNSRRKNR